jgi:hypothetical protein
MDERANRRRSKPAEDSAETNARPTARPPFDPVQFARDSENLLGTGEGPDSGRPTVPPDPGLGFSVPPAPPAPIIRETHTDPSGMRAINRTSSPDIEIDMTIDAEGALGGDVPVLAVSRDDLEWFDLSPVARSLLLHVNGLASIEAICVKSRVAAEEGAALLLELAEQGIISFR